MQPAAPGHSPRVSVQEEVGRVRSDSDWELWLLAGEAAAQASGSIGVYGNLPPLVHSVPGFMWVERE